jgi:DNA-binding CsgD family transcriptional regulator
MRRLLGEARAGAGSLLLVTGEPGIGKSRLLAELGHEGVKEAMVVLRGTATEGSPAYRPIAQALLHELRTQPYDEAPELRPYRAALGRLLPGWATGDDRVDDVDPVLVLGEGVVRLLARIAGDAGCLLLLEDLHWADPDSLALLEYLASAMRGSRVLVAGSARYDSPDDGVLRRLAAAPGVTSLSLAPLEPADIRQLAEDRLGRPLSPALAAYVVERSEGLPLLAEELAEGGTGQEKGVPPTFAGEVTRRVTSLAPAARAVLQAAAVLGGDAEWSLLPELTGLPEDLVWEALRTAVSAHLLLDAGDLRWRHALTRDAVLATLLPPERAALALQAARLLLARGDREDDVRAAHLLLVAGDVDAGAAMLVREAGRERGRGALGTAERLLSEAESAAPGLTSIATERVLVVTLAGRPLEALERGAAALHGPTGDEHAELCLRLARAAVDVRRWDEAERYALRAGRPDDPRSHTLRADAAHGAGRVDEARTEAAVAVELAEHGGNPQALCDALVSAGRLERLADLDRAASTFARAAQVAAEHALTPSHVDALVGLGTVELFSQETSPSLALAAELSEQAGLLSAAVSIELLLAEQTLLDGGPSAVLETGAGIVERAGALRLHGTQAMGGALVAMAHAGIGDVPAMTAALDAVTSLPDIPPDVTATAASVHAYVALLAHDLSGADAALDRAVPPLLAHGVAAPLHPIGWWVLLRTVAGDGGEGAREMVRGLAAGQRPANRAALRYADAVAAGRKGRSDEAVAAFIEAGDSIPHSAWWRRVLRLVTLESAVVDGWGDPVPELRANLAEHELAGEERLAAICRDLLRRAGVSTRRGRGEATVAPRLRAAGVTSREMDVLTLLRKGLSNAEIAGRLYLSVRTVETHVTHLLAKSGSADRTALAAWSQADGDGQATGRS